MNEGNKEDSKLSSALARLVSEGHLIIGLHSRSPRNSSRVRATMLKGISVCNMRSPITNQPFRAY